MWLLILARNIHVRSDSDDFQWLSRALIGNRTQPCFALWSPLARTDQLQQRAFVRHVGAAAPTAHRLAALEHHPPRLLTAPPRHHLPVHYPRQHRQGLRPAHHPQRHHQHLRYGFQRVYRCKTTTCTEFHMEIMQVLVRSRGVERQCPFRLLHTVV